jgi:uncharacterized protein (TIGR01777 family)
MKIAVSGASGFLGGHLCARLTGRGHEVLRLVRRQPQAADEVFWDPYGAKLDPAGLAGVEAVVHLAGAGLGDQRWTTGFKQHIRDSRVLGTRTLVAAITQLDPLPEVLISASATGFYGSRGDQQLTESSEGGEGFLSDVVREWEAQTQPAVDAGIRVATIRTGLVLAQGGGALATLLPLIRAGVAGPLGDGRQWWSWITAHDEISAIEFLLDQEIGGPVNLVGPEPARQKDVVRALARQWGRPAFLPAPAFALRLALGEFAGETLSSQRVLPRRLVDAGFEFTHPDLDSAVRWIAES